MIEFEWDPAKAESNILKHGVSFYEACEVFEDFKSSTVHDPDHSQEEERYLRFVITKDGKFLVVSYTERNDRVRLISARQMTSNERKAYE